MLKLDEEVILNSLLKLRDKIGSNKITGSFEDFPVKFQICYKEILERLEAKNIIKDFSDFHGENFVLTLQPSSLDLIIKNAASKAVPPTPVTESRTTSSSESLPSDSNIEKRISAIEKIIDDKGGEDKEALKNLMEEIRELCENLSSHPTIQPRKTLIKRLVELNKYHPWVYGEAVKIFGVTMIEILSGK